MSGLFRKLEMLYSLKDGVMFVGEAIMDQYKNFSAIILSGGKSSRMGTDKCDLIYEGDTLLNFQVNKMMELGIDDIIAAGYRGSNCKCKVIKDDISKGPVSGILVGLKKIKYDRAVVLSVDVPLIRKETIQKIMIQSVDKDLDIVIARHSGKREPLVGIYKKNIIEKIEKVLNEDDFSAMKLFDMCDSGMVDVDDDDKYFINVNYREDYNILLHSSV